MIAPSAVESMKSTAVRSSTTHGSAPAVAIESTVASRGRRGEVELAGRRSPAAPPPTGSSSTV